MRARLQVQRALLLGHAAAEEVDAGHGRRHRAQHRAHRVARHFSRRRRRHVQACAAHARGHPNALSHVHTHCPCWYAGGCSALGLSCMHVLQQGQDHSGRDAGGSHWTPWRSNSHGWASAPGRIMLGFRRMQSCASMHMQSSARPALPYVWLSPYMPIYVSGLALCTRQAR